MFNNDVFIEQLLIKANPNMDDEALDLLMEDVKPILFDRVMTTIAGTLSDTQLQEFMVLIKAKAPEKKISEFLNKAIPDYEDFIADVYDDFEEMYLEESEAFTLEEKKKTKK